MKIEFYDKETGKAVQGWYVADEMGDVLKLHYGAWNGISAEIADGIGWRIIDQWQPIETAPKDGTDLLLSNGCALDYGFFCKDTNKFTTENPFFMPTHWMLQPPNPKDKE